MAQYTHTRCDVSVVKNDLVQTQNHDTMSIECIAYDLCLRSVNIVEAELVLFRQLQRITYRSNLKANTDIYCCVLFLTIVYVNTEKWLTQAQSGD